MRVVADTRSLSTAQEKRKAIQDFAAQLGIDETRIARIVDEFYLRIRSDDRIAHVFEDRIEDWDHHLAKMKAFWGGVALNTGAYSGKPAQVHQRLDRATRDHFAIWLQIFRETLIDLLPNELAIQYFFERAERMACNFQRAMFDRPPQAALVG